MDLVTYLWLLSIAFVCLAIVQSNVCICRYEIQWMAQNSVECVLECDIDASVVPQFGRNLECPHMVFVGIELDHRLFAILLGTTQ